MRIYIIMIIYIYTHVYIYIYIYMYICMYVWSFFSHSGFRYCRGTGFLISAVCVCIEVCGDLPAHWGMRGMQTRAITSWPKVLPSMADTSTIKPSLNLVPKWYT